MSDPVAQRDRVLVEVAVHHARDVAGAQEGGADRLFVTEHPEWGGRSPEPVLVSGVCRESDLPVRVMLRLGESLTTTGGEIARLVGLSEDYLAVGAEGVVLGFLDADLEIDLEVCSHLAGSLPGVPWSFSRAFDQALSPERSWRRLAVSPGLPGLDAVLSAGSPRGLEHGHEELTDRAAADPRVAALAMPAGGLQGEHVPWLVRAGVRQFQVGHSVRPGGSWDKAYVDAAHVRAWRLLLDDELARATTGRERR